MHASDRVFTGSIPRLYETHLVPLIFAPYAADLAARVAARSPERVLEIAAGTGAVTRALDQRLPAHVRIVATDLNQAMLDEAARIGTTRDVEWRVADALALPFDDATFDVVACQFGAMFFADRARAYSEMRRVLRPGGTLLFNVWDRLGTNDFARVVTDALAERYPAAPPAFLARTPHGYSDPAVIAADLRGGGFAAAPATTTVRARSRAARAFDAAFAYCQGTPLRNEIEAVDPGHVDDATAWATRAMVAEYGEGPVDGAIQAHVVTIARD